ncbi:glucose-methanol-choline oxidoreductase [Histoplasma capsulatum var. duboisii H88]|uniref:Glucose-methanol-choline oxidoreductase n=1 Tax=Ajellomyces capsulatus (strain H88) TaxID=544711 RepID=A0A8A1LDE2_AJEC8|nr:glucose-methanol-choline oxidoreductase [Histoplasma capsulatum var. duboisii H88]
MNWGYTTVPQEYCNNRELDYSRGRGVGGSSAINFGVYSLGARDDYDEWAKIVGDDAFNWDHIHARFKELETFHCEVPAGVNKKYAAPKAADHGTTGPLHVGYAAGWEKDLVPTLDIFEQAGFPLNPDHNSGNPIGMSVLINSAHKGLRSTAKDLLKRQAQNRTIITNSPVQRLLLEDNKAVGVVTNGTRYLASKEVILSAGALDTPKILMHSGIGLKGQLENSTFLSCLMLMPSAKVFEITTSFHSSTRWLAPIMIDGLSTAIKKSWTKPWNNGSAMPRARGPNSPANAA